MEHFKLSPVMTAVFILFITLARANTATSDVWANDAFDAQGPMEARIDVLKHMNVWLRNKEMSTFFRSMDMKVLRSNYLAMNRGMVNELVEKAYELNASPAVIQNIVAATSLDHQKSRYIATSNIADDCSFQKLNSDVVHHASMFWTITHKMTQVASGSALLDVVDVYKSVQRKTSSCFQVNGAQRIDRSIYSQAEIVEDIATDVTRDRFLKDLEMPSMTGMRLPYPIRPLLKLKRNIASLTVSMMLYEQKKWDAVSGGRESEQKCPHALPFALFDNGQSTSVSALFPLADSASPPAVASLVSIIQDMDNFMSDVLSNSPRTPKTSHVIRNAILSASKLYKQKLEQIRAEQEMEESMFADGNLIEL